MILKWKLRVIHNWLVRANRAALYRIDLGDFDLDDTVYRTRDATEVLLEIYWPDAR